MGVLWFCHTNFTEWYATKQAIAHGVQEAVSLPVLECWDSSLEIWIYHHHQHHISFMDLGHLLARSCLTYSEVSSKVYRDSFCQLWCSVSLPWVIYFEAFYLYVVSSFSCIPVICPKLVLFLTPLQFVHLFRNLSQVYSAVILMYLISAAVILLGHLL